MALGENHNCAFDFSRPVYIAGSPAFSRLVGVIFKRFTSYIQGPREDVMLHCTSHLPDEQEAKGFLTCRRKARACSAESEDAALT